MTGRCLIGSTGFVGGNLAHQTAFDAAVNSRTVSGVHGQNFDLVVCAAPQAKKWWANQNPDEDLRQVNAVIASLRKIGAAHFILVSTIDVMPRIATFDGQIVDESLNCDAFENHAYGRHRLALESAVRDIYDSVTVLRLPALFGPGLKKNALFDLINDNNLHLIHPDSRFQWYDIGRLADDCETARRQKIELAVLATEPVRTGRIRDIFFPGKPLGPVDGPPPCYDVHTRHSDAFGGYGAYIEDTDSVLSRIARFVAAEPRTMP